MIHGLRLQAWGLFGVRGWWLRHGIGIEICLSYHSYSARAGRYRAYASIAIQPVNILLQSASCVLVIASSPHIHPASPHLHPTSSSCRVGKNPASRISGHVTTTPRSRLRMLVSNNTVLPDFILADQSLPRRSAHVNVWLGAENARPCIRPLLES